MRFISKLVFYMCRLQTSCITLNTGTRNFHFEVSFPREMPAFIQLTNSLLVVVGNVPHPSVADHYWLFRLYTICIPPTLSCQTRIQDNLQTALGKIQDHHPVTGLLSDLPSRSDYPNLVMGYIIPYRLCKSVLGMEK